MTPRIEAKPEPHDVPMIIQLTKTTIMELVNAELERRGQPQLNPLLAQVTVPVPGGGDWSNMDLSLNDDQAVVEIRWKA